MDAKLKELQEQKNTKAAVIQDLAKRQDKWTAEDRAAWDVVNKEYDETAAALTARDTELKGAAAVQARLKQIEDEQRAISGDKAIGFDGDRRREFEPERREIRDLELRANALQGWALSQLRSGFDLRKEHIEACREFNFNPRSKDIILSPDGMFQPIPVGADSSDIPLGTARRRYGEVTWSCGGVQQQREIRVGLDVTNATQGKETIPQGFMADLDKKTLAYGNVRQLAKVINTASGNDMPWPTFDDTANEAAVLGEATTIGTSVDPATAAITLKSWKLSSKPVFVSNELLQDSAFNLASELAEAMGIRFGRGETTYFTTGTSTTQPQGVVAAAGTGITSAVAAVFTADELIGLVHSLDPSYRSLPSTGFMFHDTTLAYIRKFKDANGQYLWQPGMAAGSPDRIFGFPYSINQKMAALVSNVPVTANKHVLFGAFEKYIIRDCGGVRMYHLLERYRDVDQDCFVAFKRVDGRALNTSAFKVLLQA